MNILSSSMMFELNVISPKDARQHLDFPQQLGLSKCALSTCVFQDKDSDGKTCQSLQSLLDPQFWLRYRLIYAGWYQECDFSLASISCVRPLGEFAARAWQACGCWKPTAACARQRGSSCEWTCPSFTTSKDSYTKLHLTGGMPDSCAPILLLMEYETFKISINVFADISISKSVQTLHPRLLTDSRWTSRNGTSTPGHLRCKLCIGCGT